MYGSSTSARSGRVTKATTPRLLPSADDPERHRLVRDVREVFDCTRRRWRETRETGAALYRYAASEAATRGWQLDFDMAGHRLGAYPHSEFHDGTLAQAEFTPSPGLWMLEIQLRHPGRPYSAFFEDLLLEAGRDLNSGARTSPAGPPPLARKNGHSLA